MGWLGGNETRTGGEDERRNEDGCAGWTGCIDHAAAGDFRRRGGVGDDEFVCWGVGQGKTPSPALLVLSKEESFLAIVDPATLKVVGKVDTGAHPHEVATSADGKIAIVTNYGAHSDGTTLSVIDLDAQKEIRRVELGQVKGPHGVVFAGKGVWFTAEGAKAIACYWPETNKITGVLHTDQERTHMVISAGHGSGVVTTNVNSNTVMQSAI
jgi:DNA-binding beta-propeller fold protein YncE